MRPSATRLVAATLSAIVVVAAGGCADTNVVTPKPASPESVPASVRATGSGAVLTQRRQAQIADCPPADPAVEARPDGLPDVVLECLGADSRVRLAGLRDEPMIINVWASWCGPCRHEAPYLRDLSQMTQGRIRVLGIDYADPDPADAVSFAQAAGWRYPQLVDQQKVLASELGIIGPPVTLFVTADGKIAYRHSGPFTSSDQAKKLTEQHLGVTW